MLMKEIRVDTMSDYEKFVDLIFDEMKIKESIVYDKHSSTVIGFVELNDVYDQLFQLEHNDGDKVGQLVHICLQLWFGGYSAI